MLDDLFQLSQQFLRNNDREYRRYIIKHKIFDNRFSILIGQRGVGKTTAVTQYILSSTNNDFFTRKSIYIQSDHFLVKRKSLYEIAEEFSLKGGELICFDEIHKYPDWSIELKSIYDTFKRLKIIATGSSILELSKGSHDLSRRAIVYKMSGMSFKEFIEIRLSINLKSYTLEEIISNHQSIAEIISRSIDEKKEKVLHLFDEYLKYGYYPFFLEYKNKRLFNIALDQSIHTTLESDLISIYPSLSGNSIQKISKLLSIISEHPPFAPDLKRLKNILDIGDERTLKLYLKYLEDAGLIHQLFKNVGGLRQMEKPAKIYLNNTNIIYAVSEINEANIGNVRETFFLSMLKSTNDIFYTEMGDFKVKNKYIFEIGGKNKSFKQIRNIKDSFLALDDMEIGVGSKIPLYLFGFLY